MGRCPAECGEVQIPRTWLAYPRSTVRTWPSGPVSPQVRVSRNPAESLRSTARNYASQPVSSRVPVRLSPPGLPSEDGRILVLSWFDQVFRD